MQQFEKLTSHTAASCPLDAASWFAVSSLMPRWLPLLALGTLVASPLPASEKTAAPDAWQTALSFDYNLAAERFAKLHAEQPADARIAIAYASSLLVKQPRTEDNILKAHALLVQVREAFAATSAHNAASVSSSVSSSAAGANENSLVALYLMARIELDHLDPARPDDARAHFIQLRKENPTHVLADASAVELAYLAAYKADGANAAAVPEIEAFLSAVKDPGAARDLHSLLANLQLRVLKKPAAALPHFVAARAIGYEQPLRNADVDLTIANLARETGDPTLARAHYESFLKDAPRDARSTTVRRIVASLDANSAASAR